MNISTGRFKGRRLESVDSLSTRPTLARVKESLFCMLDGAIEGKTCLDLFAGSGALGIEAISRGAKKVVFVDSSRDALRVLNKNLRGMEEWAQVIENDFVSALAGLRGVKFDVVFLDPPYANVNSSMYFGNFNNTDFFKFLENLNCKWILTYDGKSGEIDHTYDVPEFLYKEHLYLESGNSSFRNLKKNVEKTITYESLYINF